MIQSLLPIFCLVSLTQPLSAAWQSERSLASPDGALVFLLERDDASGVFAWSATHANRPVVTRGALGIEFSGIGVIADEGTISNIETRSVDTAWIPPFGEQSTIPDKFREEILTINHAGQGSLSTKIQVRAYNEGVALRYLIGGTGPFTVASEKTSFPLPTSAQVWTSTTAQGWISKVAIGSAGNGLERPLTAELATDLFCSIGEAGLRDGARMKFNRTGASTLVPTLASTSTYPGPFATAWRYVRAATSAAALAQGNHFMLNLNEHSEIADTSWIRPGKVIREVSLTTDGGRASIDWAAAHGVQFILFDAGWYGPEATTTNATQVNVDPARSPGPLDLQQVIDYGKTKGIGVILYVNHIALEAQLPQLLLLYKQWGVAGIKFGFVNVGSQQWTDWLHDAISACAANQLMVNVHDEYRMTGLERTLPNFMTAEGVAGDETSAKNEDILKTLFTRGLAGAADQTNCYFHSRIATMGSHASQIAKSVCIYSPWQHVFWYDSPPASPAIGGVNTRIQDVPELTFFERLPTIWDETRWLEGYPGAFATVARRKGDQWFIGAINGTSARNFSVPLDFLTTGQNYRIEVFSDDPAAASVTKVRIDSGVIDRSYILNLVVAVRNGFSVILTPTTDALSPPVLPVPSENDLYWDGGTANIGTNGDGASTYTGGTWSTGIQNWDPAPVGSAHVVWNNLNLDTAIFGGTYAATGTKTVLLGSNITVNQIKIQTGSGTNDANRYDIGATSDTTNAITFGGTYSAANPAITCTSPGVANTNFSAKITGTINGGLVIAHGSNETNPSASGRIALLNPANDFIGDVKIIDGSIQPASNFGNAANKIVLAGGALLFSGTMDQTRGIDVTANSGIGLTNTAALTLSGAITGSGNLTRYTTTATQELKFTGDMTGYSGIIDNTGLGITTIQTTGINGGGWKISGGTLKLNTANDTHIADGAGKRDLLMNGGTLDMNGKSETINGLSGATGTLQNQLAATTSTLTLGAGDANASFGGVIRNNSGSGGTLAIVKTGSGTQTLTAANTYTGGTIISGGKLAMSGSLASAVYANGGKLVPLGTPAITGDLTITSGGRMESRVNGATPSTGYDQLTVNGAVILAGALDVVSTSAPPSNTTFVIINKTSAGAVSGTFDSLPEGASFAVNGRNIFISYFGGDGNDVTLSTSAQLTAIELWRLRYFGTSANAGDAADGADPDNDGITNINEFNAGTDPVPHPYCTFTALPKPLQLYPRDRSTGQAIVRIEGKVLTANASQVTVSITRSGAPYSTTTRPLTYNGTQAAFSIDAQITAELADYAVTVQVTSDGAPSTVATVNGIVAGDVYLVNGQSNAVARLFNGSANGNQSNWIRSFGTRDEVEATVRADTAWHIAEGDNEFGPGTVGQWSLRMGKALVDVTGVPVCILNHGRGGKAISYFQCNDSDPTSPAINFGQLLYRAQQAGVADAVRAIFFYQGEADGGGAATHETGWINLYQDWLTHYPRLEKIYEFQLHFTTGASYTTAGAVDLRNRQRRFADLYEKVVAVSTSGLAQHTDNTHYAYETGYRPMGEMVSKLVLRDLYGSTQPRQIAAPNIEYAYYTDATGTRINIVTRNPDDQMTFPTALFADFRIEGLSAAVVTSGSASGNVISLTFDRDVRTGTGLTHIGHLGGGPFIANAEGTGLFSFYNQPILSTLVQPATPAGLQAAAPGGDLVNLTWTATANATHYVIRRDGVVIGTAYRASFTDNISGLHSYEIAASGAGGTSAWSPVVSASTVVDVFFVGGQSNATTSFRDGVTAGLTAAASQFPNRQIVWINHSGNPIANWYNGGRMANYLTDMYDPSAAAGLLEAACNSLTAAGKQYRIRGLFWFQGESDTHNVPEADLWAGKFTGMMNQLATDLNGGNPIPFALTLISYNPALPPLPPNTPTDQVAAVAAMRVIQRDYALATPLGSYADSDGYTRTDTWHLTSSANISFGTALANAFVAAQPGVRYWDTSTAGGLQTGDGTWGGANALWSSGTGVSATLGIWKPVQDALFFGNGASNVSISGTQSTANFTLVGGSTLGGTINTTVMFSGGALNTPELAVRGATSAGATILNVNGTTISGAGDLCVQVGGATAGAGTSAALNHNSGALSFANLAMGGYGSSSAYTITGGSLTLGGGITMGSSGTSVLALNGGQVATTGITGSAAGTQSISFSGGTLKAGATNPAFIDMAVDSLTIGAGGATFDSNAFIITIAKAISGSGAFTKTGGGTLTLAGACTHAGDTLVSHGTLELTGSMKFNPGANGVCNRVTGSGAANFNGTFAIDLTNAAVASGNSWNLVNTASLNETFAAAFNIPGFTENANVWTKVDANTRWTFSEATGTLAVLSGYDAWMAGYPALADTSPGGDPDHDGETNLLEFATGQNPDNATSATPGIVKNGAKLEFTYKRSLSAMSDGVTFTVEWSDTLAADSWSSAGVTEQILSDNGTVQTVQASVAAGSSGRRFLHLKVTK